MPLMQDGPKIEVNVSSRHAALVATLARRVVPALALGAALLASGQASAQSAASPNMPPPATTVPEKIDPPLNATPDTTGTLSDQLKQSGGVIAPPSGVDPEIHKPAPEGDAGRMPVIKPPGPSDGSAVVPQ